MTNTKFWEELQKEAFAIGQKEILLAPIVRWLITNQSIANSLTMLAAQKLAGDYLDYETLMSLLGKCLDHHPEIIDHIIADLQAVQKRDPACNNFVHALLCFKGIHAILAYRLAHALYKDGQIMTALLLQSQTSQNLGVDIHPAAILGHGLMIDHATSLVIGESTHMGNDCSILHNVTLGGTGKDKGDRHPKIGHNVLIGAGAKILGNITIGDGVRIAAGSVVLKPVPAYVTVAGVPARIIGKNEQENPAENMDHML